MNGSPVAKVALFIRNGGSESPCRWFYITGIYSTITQYGMYDFLIYYWTYRLPGTMELSRLS